MLRFKEIKEFADTLPCYGPQQCVFPAPYDDLLKSDSIGELFFPRGMTPLSNYLASFHNFLVPPSVLESSTFSHLLDMVNPPKFDPRTPDKVEVNIPTVFAPETHFAPPEKVSEFTFSPHEPEFLDGGYANPLYCKDELYKAGREIMMKKNHDYRGGSGDPYANFRGSTTLGVGNIVGILLRSQDKFQRIRTFAEKGMLAVEDESVKDALIDVQNYMDLIWGLIKEMSHDSK